MIDADPECTKPIHTSQKMFIWEKRFGEMKEEGSNSCLMKTFLVQGR